jgi:hypothetical protein
VLDGNKNEKGNMMKLCGLWENQGPKGNYLSGYLGDTKVLIFPNKFKEPGSRQPDFTMHLAPKPRKSDSGFLSDEENEPGPDGDPGAAYPAAGDVPDGAPGGKEGDIPF